MRTKAILLGALACSACATTATTPPVASLPAAEVTAKAETAPVGTAAADAADDPAIWRNPADPAKSLIVATDKRAGLHVYGLGGPSRFFEPDGRLNNVDLVDLGPRGVIVVASDRNDVTAAKLRLYRLDTEAAKLIPLGAVEGGRGEAYGVCLWAHGDALHAFSVLKDGTIEEFRLELDGTPRSVPVATRKVATQTEGCVTDPRDGTLYVGEEDVGVWRYVAGQTQGSLVAKADGKQLVMDTEGLALITEGDKGGFLVASSQGDNAYAVYRLPGMEPAGRFRVAAGQFGATSETDGIALMGGSFGADYPAGLFVAQDGDNAPHAQNFKLVSWADVLKALGL
ncbi:phytase [Novosphingobium sp. JCM 18896]|uniref:phytase n=1 Tax=Novosphingobium sp. JCM 18896 TaxID=2989731 RepID=UPI0022234D30|nr:phytase [Novosphingobium sp. JCM 18896]MCW1428233.1 phytase [Novosphingobium sp. JCM 18896]